MLDMNTSLPAPKPTKSLTLSTPSLPSSYLERRVLDEITSVSFLFSALFLLQFLPPMILFGSANISPILTLNALPSLFLPNRHLCFWLWVFVLVVGWLFACLFVFFWLLRESVPAHTSGGKDRRRGREKNPKQTPCRAQSWPWGLIS